MDDEEEDVGGSWEGCRADDLTEETPTPAEGEEGREAGSQGETHFVSSPSCSRVATLTFGKVSTHL